MDEARDGFEYVYTRYVLECVRNGNSPLTPDELRALIEALAEARLERDGRPGG